MSNSLRFLIEKYFEELLSLKEKADSIRAAGFKNESLTLICCYIDAIASQYYSDGSQSKRFAIALMDLSEEEFFKQIHPAHALKKISEKSCFSSSIPQIKSLVEPMVGEFRPIEEMKQNLLSIGLNSAQRQWIQDNLYKGSVAAIAYEFVRCDAVHALWATDLSFSQVTYKGGESPKITYDLLAHSYSKIVGHISEKCIDALKWPWEIGA